MNSHRPATHNRVIGYLFWRCGFTGAHRFDYGRPVTGVIGLFTAGLLGAAGSWMRFSFLA